MNGVIDILMPRLADYGPGDAALFYRGDSAGNPPDYNAAAENNLAAEVLPDGIGGIGWGLGPWGESIWGFDPAQSPGWGRGAWGWQWGFGCQLLEWQLTGLADGTYVVGTVIEDAAGNRSAAVERTVVVEGVPEPVTDLVATDLTAGVLTVAFTA